MDQKLLLDAKRSIAKSDLIDGQYYVGKCRNSRIARWNQTAGQFVYWRFKFGNPFVESIQHPEDAGNNRFDYFAPFMELKNVNIPVPIPYGEGDMTHSQRDIYLKWMENVLRSIPAWAS